MSLKNTETLYNLVIKNVTKEIQEDPQMSSVSHEALEYLERVWEKKLNESGVFTPHPSEYQRHVGNAMLPIRPSPGGPDYMASMNNQAMDPQHMANFYQQRFFPPFNQPYRPDWIPPQGNPDQMQMFQGHFQNIMFDAKPTLVSGNQHPMNPQMLQHYNMGMGMQQMNSHPGNVNDKMKQAQKEPSKTTINIKGEDSEEQNNSKLPVKVPTNGDGKGLIDVSTGTPRTNATSETPGATNKPAEKEKPVQEEEKKNDTNGDADDEQEEEAAAPRPEEEDDEDLFEYNVDEKKDVIQTKEEHIPPPLQQNVAQPAVNLLVTDLDPYNPQDRPLDSDDDPDYAETPDTTDILLAFHEKVHRHGSKWKVTLKQGIMNARGKEYILSQITGDFDFM
jgi:hypothetical protein